MRNLKHIKLFENFSREEEEYFQGDYQEYDRVEPSEVTWEKIEDSDIRHSIDVAETIIRDYNLESPEEVEGESMLDKINKLDQILLHSNNGEASGKWEEHVDDLFAGYGDGEI